MASEALANNARLAKLLQVVGVCLAVYVAIVVTIASVIGVINSLRSVEQAKRATVFAKEAKEQAKLNEGVAKDIKLLVERQSPCVEGAPLDSPACVTKARTDKIVNDAIAQLTGAVDSHDKTTHASHDALMSAIRRRPTTTSRTAITAAPRTPDTTARTTTTTPAVVRVTPPTTAVSRPAPAPTTTCPTKGKRPEHCR